MRKKKTGREENKMDETIIKEINKKFKGSTLRKSSLINFIKSLNLKSEPTKTEKYLIYREVAKNVL